MLDGIEAETFLERLNSIDTEYVENIRVTVIEQVYDGLKRCEKARSQYEFSSDWCGMSRSYYSWLKAANARPSVTALATLYVRLEQEAERLESTDGLEFPEVAEHDARALRGMALRLKSELLNTCGVPNHRSTDHEKGAQ